ncbi:hypothetical protein SAMN05660642_01707 [Geodermatophilus siccatus]|uniref:Uncharacterized protein n=1 Tax=Geodermatophilus siccatus TaxID=1137991 RepID=A0A1G9QJS7_9ACTN|nr:hypothetical protein SAMN05660642_01707 [Geodermatophilus siccatus]
MTRCAAAACSRPPTPHHPAARGRASSRYPYILGPGITVEDAAAPDAVRDAVRDAVLISLAVGAVLLVPSLVWLYVLFQCEDERPHATGVMPPKARD